MGTGEENRPRELEAYRGVRFSPGEDEAFTGRIRTLAARRRRARSSRQAVLSALGAVLMTLIVLRGGEWIDTRRAAPESQEWIDLTPWLEGARVQEELGELDLSPDDLTLAVLDEESARLYSMIEQGAESGEDLEHVLGGFSDQEREKVLELVKQAEIL